MPDPTTHILLTEGHQDWRRDEAGHEYPVDVPGELQVAECPACYALVRAERLTAHTAALHGKETR